MNSLEEQAFLEVYGDILLTIKGRIGNAAVIEHLDELVNINQDVALLRFIPIIHPYYIAGFINSFMGKLLIEQTCTGQINPFLSLGSLRKLVVPIFSEKRMNDLGDSIKAKVTAADKTGWQSKRLLEIAKTGVERAILLQRGSANETDEATATAWINHQLEALDINLTTTT